MAKIEQGERLRLSGASCHDTIEPVVLKKGDNKLVSLFLFHTADLSCRALNDR